MKRHRRVNFSHRDLDIQVPSMPRTLLALLKEPLDTHIDLSVILGLLQATQASHVPRTLPSILSRSKTAHYNALQRTKNQGVHEWATAHGISREEGEMFQFFGVRKESGIYNDLASFRKNMRQYFQISI